MGFREDFIHNSPHALSCGASLFRRWFLFLFFASSLIISFIVSSKLSTTHCRSALKLNELLWLLCNLGPDNAPFKSTRAFLLTGMGAGSSPWQSLVFRTLFIRLIPTNCKSSDLWDTRILTMQWKGHIQGYSFLPTLYQFFNQTWNFHFFLDF